MLIWINSYLATAGKSSNNQVLKTDNSKIKAANLLSPGFDCFSLTIGCCLVVGTLALISLLFWFWNLKKDVVHTVAGIHGLSVWF